MNKPLCFVLMPFGKKPDASGNLVDFDEVYKQIIKPAVEEADLEPIRADEEVTGGMIHKPMFERLILCEYAVADLTTANANVFYELGLRHAVRPCSTVLIFSGSERLPFDVAPLRALPYKLTPDGLPEDPEKDKAAIKNRLLEACKEAADNSTPAADSPLYQLVEDYPNVAHEKTDIFRKSVEYSRQIKDRLEAARKEGSDAVRAVEITLGDLKKAESAPVIDLFLSYRAVRGWTEMIELVDKMTRPLAATVMVREQLALALNRAGRGEEAETVLVDLLEQRGASSETLGILGRVYKDRWEDAVKQGKILSARGMLEKAIDAYLRGFEADWRDAYPGINAVTLMALKEPADPRLEKVLPVVRYAVEQRVARGKPDYWDFATLLELAVLGKDESEAMDYAGKAIAAVREKWEPETTLRNLRLIREAREKRQEDAAWITEIESALADETK
jgi:tetratricopeptide (TPR) repeat protein